MGKPKSIGTRLKVVIKYLGYTIVVLLVLLLLAIGGINWYLNSNKAKVIDQLPTLPGATISFQSVQVHWWQDFPSITVTLNEFLLHDSLYVIHQIPLTHLRKLQMEASFNSFLQDSIQIQGIKLQHGEVNIFEDTVGYNNLNSLLPRLATQEKSDTASKTMEIWYDQLDVILQDIAFTYNRIDRNANIKGLVEEMNITLQMEDRGLHIPLELKMQMDELGLNLEKGAFLEDSRLEGKLDLYVDNDGLIVPLSPLKINDQHFQVGANIKMGGEMLSQIQILNPDTDFEASIPLLTRDLQEKMVNYKVEGTFATKTTIEGTFVQGDKPSVEIDFTFAGNDIMVMDYLFESVNTRGKFINVTDTTKAVVEQPGRSSLLFYQLNGYFKSFHFDTPLASLRITPDDAILKTSISIDGQANGISEWFDSEQFVFEKGDFMLHADVDGSIKSFNDIAIYSYAILELEDLEVLYTPENAIFPFDRLFLRKNAGEARFNLMSSYVNPVHDLNLDGLLENLPAILFNYAQERARSEVDLKVTKVTWSDLLHYFDREKKVVDNNDPPPTQTMKRTFQGIQLNFQPSIKASADTLEYYDRLQLLDFNTGLHFEDDHTLVLEETKFFYQDGEVDLSAKIDISDPRETPFEVHLKTSNLNLASLLPPLDYFGLKVLENMDSLPEDLNLEITHKGLIDDELGLVQEYNDGKILFNDGITNKIDGSISYFPSPDGLNMSIQIHGDPELINQFYQSKEFLFRGGEFEVSFAYVGDVSLLKDLVRDAQAGLIIKNTDVYYLSADTYFPVKQLTVQTEDNSADFSLSLHSDTLQKELQLTGKFDNLQGFLLDEEDRSFQVQVDAYAPYFELQDLESLIQSTPNNKDKQKPTQAKVRESITGLLTTFNPSFQVRFDTLSYSEQLFVESFHTGLRLKDSHLLVLDKTGFTFHDGSLEVQAMIDLSEEVFIPFQLSLEMTDLDVASLMEKADYLSIKALQETQKIEGRLSMDLDFKGTFDPVRETLIWPDNDGVIQMNLENVEVVGLGVIDSLAEKIHHERRFADLRFAPLTSTIVVDGHQIDLPLMEIQSNALQLFAEGRYQQNQSSEFWISIPLSNLKKPKLDSIPDKTGYALAGKKVFLAITQDEEGKPMLKFRTSKRRLYRAFDMLRQYRIDQKRYRKIRKEAKKGGN